MIGLNQLQIIEIFAMLENNLKMQIFLSQKSQLLRHNFFWIFIFRSYVFIVTLCHIDLNITVTVFI